MPPGRPRPAPEPPRPDWAQPWFAPYAELGPRLEAAWTAGGDLAQALNALAAMAASLGGAAPPRFVPARTLPRGEAYEAFVARTACVPVRDDWHDAFNGLVWLRHPALKRALNAAHVAEIARHGIGPTRGARRDALTLLDENGALVAGPPSLRRALRERDWIALFVTGRASWAQARVEIVGHGLLRQLAAAPRKGLTAHAWLVPPGDFDAPRLPASLAPAAWSPLPVLGVPGWWPDNVDAAFYADPAVFRPPRLGTPAAAPNLRRRRS